MRSGLRPLITKCQISHLVLIILRILCSLVTLTLSSHQSPSVSVNICAESKEIPVIAFL